MCVRVYVCVCVCVCVRVSDLVVTLGNSQVEPKPGYDDFLVSQILKKSSAVIG